MSLSISRSLSFLLLTTVKKKRNSHAQLRNDDELNQTPILDKYNISFWACRGLINSILSILSFIALISLSSSSSLFTFPSSLSLRFPPFFYPSSWLHSEQNYFVYFSATLCILPLRCAFSAYSILTSRRSGWLAGWLGTHGMRCAFYSLFFYLGNTYLRLIRLLLVSADTEKREDDDLSSRVNEAKFVVLNYWRRGSHLSELEG